MLIVLSQFIRSAPCNRLLRASIAVCPRIFSLDVSIHLVWRCSFAVAFNHSLRSVGCSSHHSVDSTASQPSIAFTRKRRKHCRRHKRRRASLLENIQLWRRSRIWYALCMPTRERSVRRRSLLFWRCSCCATAACRVGQECTNLSSCQRRSRLR